MAGIKISALTAASNIGLTDTLVLVQDGVTKKLTASAPWNIGGNLTVGGNIVGNANATITGLVSGGNISTAGALTSGTAVTEAARCAAYQWTTFNPSDVAGTITNAPATAAASVTATNYITMANASGTVTFTFSKAGNYLITYAIGMEAQAAYTAVGTRDYTTFGGTATRLYTAPGSSIAIGGVSGEDGNVSRSFVVVATATQTLTVLPRASVVGVGTTAQYIFGANATATYIGT